MAKITVYIPEPKEQYDVSNQRQLTASLETLKNQLNFAFQEELKQEVERFNWFFNVSKDAVNCLWLVTSYCSLGSGI